jgi:hypothetical protein
MTRTLQFYTRTVTIEDGWTRTELRMTPITKTFGIIHSAFSEKHNSILFCRLATNSTSVNQSVSIPTAAEERVQLSSHAWQRLGGRPAEETREYASDGETHL